MASTSVPPPQQQQLQPQPQQQQQQQQQQQIMGNGNQQFVQNLIAQLQASGTAPTPENLRALQMSIVARVSLAVARRRGRS
jgi:hypothetical protein